MSFLALMNNSNPAIRINLEHCIFCNSCVRTCAAQGPHVFAPGDRKTKTYPAVQPRSQASVLATPIPASWPMPKPGEKVELSASGCMHCGQCAVACPTDAITVNSDDLDITRSLLNVAAGKTDHTSPRQVVKHVVFLVAPSTRVGMSEFFDLPPSATCTRSLVEGLRKLGGPNTSVYDVNVGADTTTLEDLAEFREVIDHARKHGKPGPHFEPAGATADSPWTGPVATSCCPAWVRFARLHAQKLLPGVSTARSCVAMISSLARYVWAPGNDISPSEIAVVSVMPCSAKKGERLLPGLRTVSAGVDLDASLTVKEAAELLKENGIELTADAEPINFTDPEHNPFDHWGGVSSGAAASFGRTHGVAASVIRQMIVDTGKRPDPIDWKELEIRVPDGQTLQPGHILKEATVTIDKDTYRVGAACGGQALRFMLEELDRDPGRWDLIEVMMCPFGCVGGAGMFSERSPVKLAQRRSTRASCLDGIDEACHFSVATDGEVAGPHIETGKKVMTDLPEEIRSDILHTIHTPL